MKKIIIFGSGDHAKVLLTEILKLKRYNFLGFCDEKKKKKTRPFYKLEIKNSRS